MARFYRGKAEYFNQETHVNSLYFATDINELYLSLKDSEGNYSTRTYGSSEIINNIDLNSDGTGIVITFRSGEEKTINIADLVKVSQTNDGLMTAQDKTNLDTLISAYNNDELGKVQGVVSSDKVLSMTDKLISATISLNYDEDTKSIQLLGKNDENNNPYVLGTVDATPFIKDGMLENVEIITVEEDIEGSDEKISKKYIEFTWNVLVEGSESEYKTDRIAVEDLVISYTNGNGISISDSFEISIKLAEDTEENPNFLGLDEEGLRLSEITTDATVLQKDIVVAGLNGTLGTGKYTNGTTIKAGTSIYQILADILSQEIYPQNAKVANTGKLVSSYEMPTFTLTNSGKTVEVGTSATVSSVTGYDPTATPTSRSYSGFTNGYSLDDDDKADSTGNPPSVSVTEITLLDGTFTLTRSYDGFGLSGANLTTTSSAIDSSSNCSIPEDNTLIVKEGSNSVCFTMSGPGHSGKIVASPEYYVISNLGNTQSNKVVSAVNQVNLTNETANEGTKTLTVTGAYYYYIGYAASVPTDKDGIVALTNIPKDWCSSSGNEITTGGTLPAGKTMCICVPSTYKLSSILNGFDLESVGSFSTSTVSYELADKSSVNYTIYSMYSAADWNYKTIKLAKA